MIPSRPKAAATPQDHASVRQTNHTSLSHNSIVAVLLTIGMLLMCGCSTARVWQPDAIHPVDRRVSPVVGTSLEWWTISKDTIVCFLVEGRVIYARFEGTTLPDTIDSLTAIFVGVHDQKERPCVRVIMNGSVSTTRVFTGRFGDGTLFADEPTDEIQRSGQSRHVRRCDALTIVAYDTVSEYSWGWTVGRVLVTPVTVALDGMAFVYLMGGMPIYGPSGFGAMWANANQNRPDNPGQLE